MAKLQQSDELLYAAMLADLSNVFYQTTDSNEWQVYQQIRQPHTAETSQERIQKIKDQLQFLISLGSCTYEGKVKGGENLFSQGIFAGSKASYYLTHPEECKDRYELQKWLLSDVENKLFNFWHQLDDPGLRDVYQCSFPPIRVNQLIYVPKVAEQITIQNVTEVNQISVTYGTRKASMEADQFENVEFDELNMANYLKQKPLLNHKSEMYDAEAHVRVRLLYSKEVQIEFDKQFQSRVKEDKKAALLKASTYTDKIEKVKSKFSSIFDSEEPPFDKFMKQSRDFIGQPTIGSNMSKFRRKGVVMLHIHGGGFVAMSSASHQNYTRAWANVLDIPIFSVDYRLSPQSAFPDALNDCW